MHEPVTKLCNVLRQENFNQLFMFADMNVSLILGLNRDII